MPSRKGCLRWAAKQDVNHQAIVHDLRRSGATVQELKRVGGGCPDILVGYQGQTYLLEIKRPGEVLKENQKEWANNWRGRTSTCVTNSIEALHAVGAKIQD